METNLDELTGIRTEFTKEMTEFTKEMRDKWVDALESGEYHQAQHQYSSSKEMSGKTVITHCCLAVLDAVSAHQGWSALDRLGTRISGKLIRANDNGEPDQYERVIEIIKSIEL
jgi:hypothetical protein